MLSTLETQETNKIVYLIEITDEIPSVVSEHTDESAAAKEASRLKFEKRDRQFHVCEGISNAS